MKKVVILAVILTSLMACDKKEFKNDVEAQKVDSLANEGGFGSSVNDWKTN